MTIVAVVSLFQPNITQVDSIKGMSSLFDYLVVIDDSEATHESLFSKRGQEVVFSWNGENIGLAKTLNKGIMIAKEKGADWIVCLDQDGFFSRDIINVYVDYINNHDTSRVAMLAPQHDYDRHRRKPMEGYTCVDYCDLAGCMINSKVIGEIGSYDERFYIDGVDTEWCLRANLKGYRVIRCNNAVMPHHPAHTRRFSILGKCLFRYGWDTYERYYYQFRAFFLVHNLYHNGKYDIFFLYKILKVILLFDCKAKYLKALRDAYVDYRKGYYGKYELA